MIKPNKAAEDVLRGTTPEQKVPDATKPAVPRIERPVLTLREKKLNEKRN